MSKPKLTLKPKVRFLDHLEDIEDSQEEPHTPIKIDNLYDTYLDLIKKKNTPNFEMSVKDYQQYYRLKSLLKKRTNLVKRLKGFLEGIKTDEDCLNFSTPIYCQMNKLDKTILKSD